VDESLARSPSVSDRRAELRAVARERATRQRWGVYLTVDELELAAAAVRALPAQSVQSAALEQRFMGVARHVRGDARSNDAGGDGR
jgi:hypothetical protein